MNSHDHGHAGAITPRAVRFGAVVLAVAAAIVAVAMVLLWPGRPQPVAGSGEPPAQYTGVVEAVTQVECPSGPAGEDPAPGGFTPRCGDVTVTMETGPDRRERVNTDIPSGPGAPTVRPGERVVLLSTVDPAGEVTYQIIDHARQLQLWLLVVCFALAVVAFGRLRGLAALAGLALSFALLLYFIVPAILAGSSPLLVAIVGGAAIMLSVLYLTHGFTIATSVAVLGTLTSLTLTGVLAAVSTAALYLTGVGSEETNFLTIMYRDVNMEGLLLAGILIGSLGVLDDVAVTQAVTVTELAAANPRLSTAQLYRAGSRVGRAHITSVINTIVLAYAGASLPLLLLLSAGQAPLGQTLTSQLITQEIVRSAVGTMGLIAAVPITTMLAAITAKRLPRSAVPPPNPGDERDTAAPPPLPARTGWLDSDDMDWPRPSSP